MAITIQGLLDADYGPEIGIRFFAQSTPAIQVGADHILDRHGSISTLYTKTGITDVMVSTNYFVSIFRTDGAQTITTLITTIPSYVGDDGQTHSLGDEEPANVSMSEQDIEDLADDIQENLDEAAATAGDLNSTIEVLIDKRTSGDGITRARGDEGEFEFESIEGLAKARLFNAEADAVQGKQRLMRPLRTRLSDPNEP